MKELTSVFNSLATTEYIDRIENNSDANMTRARVYFKNGQELSIIRGPYSFGGDEGLFEIMPSDESVFDEGDDSDTVLGYLSPDRVNYYIRKLGLILA